MQLLDTRWLDGVWLVRHEVPTGLSVHGNWPLFLAMFFPAFFATPQTAGWGNTNSMAAHSTCTLATQADPPAMPCATAVPP